MRRSFLAVRFLQQLQVSSIPKNVSQQLTIRYKYATKNVITAQFQTKPQRKPLNGYSERLPIDIKFLR